MAGDHVVKLLPILGFHLNFSNISRASLKGFIAPEFYQLSTLQELILHGNLLIGSIPKEIGMLKNLKVLDLGSNQLTGPIPPEIGNLTGIEKINLQLNGLTGKLPYELGNLRYLQELRLDRNKFLGTIPASNSSKILSNAHGMYASKDNPLGFCRSSLLKVVDLSYNFLVGSIPKCLERLPRSGFQGNCLQAKDPSSVLLHNVVGVPPPIRTRPGINTKHRPIEDRSKHGSTNAKPAWLLVLEIATGIMQELEVACEDFSNIIGSSPDSLVYKGTMKGGPEIAVISFASKKSIGQATSKLLSKRDLARLNHENAGKLLGYCRESNPFTRMLVFEYASNGTLYEHLHYGEGCQFSWTRRMNIILGIARGLKYLHTELDPPFTISELSSSSVYLTEDFSPKLVDFECWKTIFSRSEKSSGTISNEGAVCILPDALEGRHLDIQGNIYAFGILLLEIVSGRPPYCKDKGCLVDWAKEFLELPDNMSYVVDPELKHFREEDLKVICEVVNLCIHPSSSTRTSMRDLCYMLESGIDTSISSEIKASSLAWAELALSS
ncbi:UNVERIFIED_CONTAM: putative LRR receptor-like serine/threonine-protein kinase [Sesamum radiatum]|uniref:LRR receptor-like serine/threonine-protein kinase n=1 Tax=Sesamum radiatum TaxID=300843 RepID=A0AAW2MEF1_SESRA